MALMVDQRSAPPPLVVVQNVGEVSGQLFFLVGQGMQIGCDGDIGLGFGGGGDGVDGVGVAGGVVVVVVVVFFVVVVGCCWCRLLGKLMKRWKVLG